jgi:hypothetical protein
MSVSKEVQTDVPKLEKLKVEAPKVEAPATAFPIVIKRVDASVRAAAGAAKETYDMFKDKLPAGDPALLALVAASNPKNIQSVRINVEGS